jgi:N-acetylglucosamine malate deacetylase 1
MEKYTMEKEIHQEPKETPQEIIITFCAHNDDQVVGAGGTLAKYAREGKRIVSVIFSFGEQSHPLLQPLLTKKTRVTESQIAERILGGHDVTYFDIKEGKFTEQFIEQGIKEKCRYIIEQKKPVKIFTHSPEDPHPDHRATHKMIMELVKEIHYSGEVYSFDVWTFINFRQRQLPKMVVDITDTFAQKIAAFKSHKSQYMAIHSLLWSVYLKAIVNGINNGCKFAEVFYRVY